MRGIRRQRYWGLLALASVGMGAVVAFWPSLDIPDGPVVVEDPQAASQAFGLAVFQIAAAAFVAALALGFIAAQSVGTTGNSRRLRYFMNDRWMWGSSLGSCALAGAVAAIIAFASPTSADDAVQSIYALAFASVGVMAALTALWSDQRSVIDPYTGAYRVVRMVTARSVVAYGFTVRRPLCTNDRDESFAIRRYSLSLATADPLGPTSEIFNQAMQDRDRVLLQAVADAVAGRICRTLFVRYPSTRLSDLSKLRTRAKKAHDPIRKLVSVRSLPVTLECLHYVVRHSANAVRELRMEAARDPWIMSLYRVLIGLSPHKQLAPHVRLASSALVAVVAASSSPDPRVDERAIDALPEIANMLGACGWPEEANLVASLAGWAEESLGVVGLVARLDSSLAAEGNRGQLQTRINRDWYPRPRLRNRWVEMLPESRTRSAVDVAPSGKRKIGFWAWLRSRLA